MARTFDNTDDYVALSLGNLGYAFGPGTVAAIVRRTTDGALDVIFQAGTASGATRWGMMVASTNYLRMRNGGDFVSAATIQVLAAGGWQLVALSRTAGAGQTPRFHQYVFSTGTWTHENSGGSPTTSGDRSAATTGATIGASPTPSEYWPGDIAVVGAWDAVLTDAQVESLAFSLQAWFQVSPRGLWLLDQSDTTQNIPDLTGGGANQSALTGTTVATSSVPIFSYGHPVRRIGGATAAVAVPRHGFVNYPNSGVF